MELCQPISSDLQLVNNNPLFPPLSSTRVIFPAMLQAQSTNVVDADISYTLVSNPAYGSLEVNGVTINPGESFTQDDIQNNLFTYTQDGTVAAIDSFKFFVEDPNGGWVGVEEFRIGIITNGEAPQAAFQLIAKPNPTRDFLSIDLSGASAENANIRLTDVRGKLMQSQKIGLSNGKAATTLDLSGIAAGLYLLEVEVNGSKQIQKILMN